MKAQEPKFDIDLGIKRFEYGEADRPQQAVLTIETGKHYNGGLRSDATLFWVGGHSRQRLMGIGGRGDYDKVLLVSAKTVKATQKNLDAQHAEVFTAEVIAGLIVEAKAHYADVVQAGVDGFKNTYAAAVAEVSNVQA